VILNNIRKNWQSFTFLLVVLLIYIFILSPFANGGFPGRLSFILFYLIFLSGGVNLLNKKRKSGIFLAFIIFPFLILLADIFFSLPRLVLGADLFIIIYCIWLGTIILKRTFFKGHINVHRIEGAIVVYLLIALIFALMYHFIFLLYGQSAFTGLSNYERSEFMYFSLTTLTTVGYGDITPVNQFARSLANLEALNGQLYPAILIARLVSMEFASSKN
jgi:voltage-gated potassium channel Kch